MDADEQMAREYLERRGFACESFLKEERRLGKTPDFRVILNESLVFYCEVKSSRDPWFDNLLENAPAGEIVGGLRNDPIFNRLVADIHEAVKQFNAVNPKQEIPNVIALVNHDDKCGFDDLLAVLTGNFYADNGIAHPIYRQFSEGRIKDEKSRIHLFIWLDDYKPERLLFSQTNEGLHLKLCQWFRIEPGSIQQIGS